MTRKEKIEYFRSSILQWFKVNGRKFPWRKKSATNYEKIMSEVLLQRTKAETVAKFYPRILKKYTSWKKLGTATIAELEEDLRPFGLHKQRAKRVFQLTGEMKKRNGRLPKNYDEIRKIPMFGQYIANAVMLLVHGKPFPLLDVNMSRVLERFFGPRKMSDIRYDPYLQGLSYRIVDCTEPWAINWGILDFAATVCKALKPLCRGCPVNLKCRFYKEYQKTQKD